VYKKNSVLVSGVISSWLLREQVLFIMTLTADRLNSSAALL